MLLPRRLPNEATVRVIGLDLGTRRIGVAVSDSQGLLATPYEVVERCGDPDLDRQRIAAIVAEAEAGMVVVGLPLSADGSDGPAAIAARAEAEVLAEVLGLPVEMHDERFSTVSANRSLAAVGVNSRRRRNVIDQVAASVLLQSWLDQTGRREAAL